MTPWIVVRHDPLSMEFSREEYCTELPFPSPIDLSNLETEPGLQHCRQILYCLSHQGSLRSLCACMLSRLVVSNSAALWTVAHQAHLSMGLSQVRILEWVAMPSSRGSSRPRDQNCVSYVSCIGKHVLYHYTTWEAHIRQYKMIWCSYQSLYISCSFPLVQ